MQIVTVVRAQQTITFDEIADVNEEHGPITLNASSNVGLAITFELMTNNASIDGNVLTVLELGTVTIQATQAGNDNYEAAIPVTRSFLVTELAVVNHTDLDEVIKINVFPNPAEETLYIETTNINSLQMKMHDLSGRIMMNEILNSNNIQLDLSKLNAGNYIISFTNQEGVLLRKSVVVKQ